MPDAGSSLLITLKSGISPQSWVNPIKNSTLEKTWNLVPGLGLWNLPAGLDAKTAIATLSKNTAVARIEVNGSVETSAVFNDPLLSQQWALSNTGQGNGLVGADINGPEALSRFAGNGSTLVAVIDSGIDYTHPELVQRMWVNPGEVPGNGLDDDKNGYVDDVYGVNVLTGSGNPMDDNGHGTHIAGIIAATGNNGQGMLGVNPNARVMAVKFLDAEGKGSLAGAISALDYAVSMGARISNNSWGGYENSPTLAEAMNRARLRGHIVVAAAGNDGQNNDATGMFPSAYTHDNIVSVASSSNRDELSWFSNLGKTSVDLAAPGDNILSTLPGNKYGLMSGTSMAAPMVTGALSLLWDRRPDLPYTSMVSALYQGADRVAALTGKVATGGRLNVQAALAQIDKLPVDRILPTVVSTEFLSDRSDRIQSIRLEFSEPMNVSSFAGNVVLRGPSGNIPVIWKAVAGLSSRVFVGTLTEQSALGTYTLTVSPRVKDLKGNLLDQNRNQVAGEAADSFSATTRLAASVNFATAPRTLIRDQQTINSAIVINESIPVQRLQVTLNLTHTDVSDLVVTLRSPWGQTFTLINRDVTGRNLRDIIFEDMAPSALDEGASPYRGTYRPSQVMGNLGGKSARGSWVLSVSDQVVVDQGTLNSWSLKFLAEPTPATSSLKLLGSAYIKPQNGLGSVGTGTFGMLERSRQIIDGALGLPGFWEGPPGLAINAQSLATPGGREAFSWTSGLLLADRSAHLGGSDHALGFLDDFFAFAVGAGNVVVPAAASAPAAAGIAPGVQPASAKPFLVAKKAEPGTAAVISAGPLDGDATVANRGEGVVRTHHQPGFVGVEVGLGEQSESASGLSG